MFNIEKTDQLVIRATKVTQDKQTIIEYEFDKRKTGWYIRSFQSNVESPFPYMREMFIPFELIDQILLIESVKEKLE